MVITLNKYSGLACTLWVLVLIGCGDQKGVGDGASDTGLPMVDGSLPMADGGRPTLDGGPPMFSPEPPMLVFGMGGNMHQGDAFERAQSYVDRAVAAGYTHVKFEPFQETLMTLGEYDNWRHPVDRYAQITDYIIASPLTLIKGHIGSTGYGEKILRADPNMAEGLPIQRAEYRVAEDGVRLDI